MNICCDGLYVMLVGLFVFELNFCVIIRVSMWLFH